MSKLYGETTVYARNMGLDLRQAYDTSGRIEYVGYAIPGTTDSKSEWQIVKYAYDGNGRLTHRRYADSTDDFTKSWDSRSGYDFTDI